MVPFLSLRRLALVVPLVGLLAASPARAALVEPLDLDGLVAHADHVLLGRVEAATPRWTRDGGAIVTEVRLVVERALYGRAERLAPGDRVVALREGGEVDGVGMRVFGAAHFTVGEEVLVFLERRGQALFTVGMAQGKFRVTVDAATGQRRLARDLSGLSFTRATPGAPRLDTLGAALDGIAAAVRRQAGRRGAGR